jgi:hypothetical protein
MLQTNWIVSLSDSTRANNRQEWSQGFLGAILVQMKTYLQKMSDWHFADEWVSSRLCNSIKRRGSGKP